MAAPILKEQQKTCCVTTLARTRVLVVITDTDTTRPKNCVLFAAAVEKFLTRSVTLTPTAT